MTTSDAATRADYVLALVAATFLMGSSFVAGKILLTDGFPRMLLVGWRFYVAALATVPLVLLDGTSFRRWRHRIGATIGHQSTSAGLRQSRLTRARGRTTGDTR